MKRIQQTLAALTASFMLVGPAAMAGELFQVSTGNALMEGLFQGAVDFKELRQKGDFGLGSVEHMDGELIAIDGEFYRIDPKGNMHQIPDSETTPYAMVTHFEPTQRFTLNNVDSLAELVQKLNDHISNRHISYAIKIHGNFKQLKLRAVHKQKPTYPTFPEVARQQAIFNLNHSRGDAVGFFTPAFMGKINVPGYHIHYITADRQTGGHILEGKFGQVTVEIMPIHRVTVALPQTSEFAQAKQLNTDFTPLLVENFGPGIQLD